MSSQEILPKTVLKDPEVHRQCCSFPLSETNPITSQSHPITFELLRQTGSERNMQTVVPLDETGENYPSIPFALELAVLLDENESPLAAEATQEENLAYLREQAGEQLTTREQLPDFPFKVQMFARLAEAGLADPETRCFPLTDILSIAARVTHLLKEGRTVWISTARVDDATYAAIPINPDAPRYEPQYPHQVAAFYKKLAESSPRDRPTTPTDFDLSTKTSPLFTGINSLPQFFLQTLPDLLALCHQEPTTFCKIFPQDDKTLSIAAASIDLQGNPNDPGNLAPSIFFEMASGAHTSRGQEMDIHAQTHLCPFPVIIGNEESSQTLASVFSQPMDNGEPLAPRLIKLLKSLPSPAIVLEFMINIKSQLAFCTDIIPITLKELQGWEAHQLNNLINSLTGARFVDSQQHPSVLEKLGRYQNFKTLAREAEWGNFLPASPRLEPLPFSGRPDWKTTIKISEKYKETPIYTDNSRAADLWPDLFS